MSARNRQMRVTVFIAGVTFIENSHPISSRFSNRDSTPPYLIASPATFLLNTINTLRFKNALL